jgi:hypothetical protein
MHKEAYKNNMVPYKKKDEANKELALPSFSKREAKVAWVRKISLLTGKFLGRLWASLFRRVKPAAKTLGPSGACLTLRPSPPLLNKTMLLAAGSALALPLDPWSYASGMLASKSTMEAINRRLVKGFSDRLIDPSSTFTLDELTMLVYKDLDQHIIYLQSLDPTAYDLFLLLQSFITVILASIEINNFWLDFMQPPGAYYNSIIGELFPQAIIDQVGAPYTSLFCLFLTVGIAIVPFCYFFENSHYLHEAQKAQEILNELFAAIDPSNEAALKEAIKEIMGKNISWGWLDYAQAAPHALFDAITCVPGAVHQFLTLALTTNFSLTFIWLLYLILIWKLLRKIISSVIKFYNASKKGFKGGQKNT